METEVETQGQTNLRQVKNNLPISIVEYTSDDNELLDDEKTKGRVILLSNTIQSEEIFNFFDEEDERITNKIKLSKI